MSIKENIKTIVELKTKVEAHCMTARFEETDLYYLVVFPLGFAVGGVRVSKELGQIKALTKVLEKCEQYWQLDQLR